MSSDVIFGKIELTKEENELILQPEIKRTNKINQLGLVYLAPEFSNAQHTRHHHSLGVLYLAGRVGKYLSLDSEQITKLRLSAILHDVGHGPFSHFSEKILGWLGKDVRHEDVSADIIRNSPNIGKVWKKHGNLPDRNEIAEIISTKKPSKDRVLDKILSNDIDIDRIDYLLRDLRFTNLKYSLDYERLIQGLTIHNVRIKGKPEQDIVIKEKYVTDANFLLLARIILRSHVYYEPVHRAAEVLIFNCLQQTIVKEGSSKFNSIDNGALKRELFYQMDDSMMLSELKKASQDNSKLIDDIKKGRIGDLYIPLEWRRLSPYIQDDIVRIDKSSQPLKKLMKLSIKLRKELSTHLSSTGISSEEIFVDIPRLETLQEASMKVLMSDGNIQRLEDFSPLARSLKEAYRELWSLLVFVRLKHKRHLTDEEKKSIEEKIEEFFCVST